MGQLDEKTDSPVLMLDLGNVVFSLDFNPFEEWLSAKCTKDVELASEKFWELNTRYEVGSLSSREFMDQVRSEVGASFSDEEFSMMWNSCWAYDTPGMDLWLSELVGKLPLCVLSNTNDLHIGHFSKDKPILKRFDRLFYSHELGCRKPEAEIYTKVTEFLDVEPSSILFFDDREENIEGAINAGWNAELFVDVGKCSKRLKQHMDKTV